jgi:hypothetical protein
MDLRQLQVLYASVLLRVASRGCVCPSWAEMAPRRSFCPRADASAGAPGAGARAARVGKGLVRGGGSSHPDGWLPWAPWGSGSTPSRVEGVRPRLRVPRFRLSARPVFLPLTNTRASGPIGAQGYGHLLLHFQHLSAGLRLPSGGPSGEQFVDRRDRALPILLLLDDPRLAVVRLLGISHLQQVQVPRGGAVGHFHLLPTMTDFRPAHAVFLSCGHKRPQMQ